MSYQQLDNHCRFFRRLDGKSREEILQDKTDLCAEAVIWVQEGNSDRYDLTFDGCGQI